jgi:predicted AlkP superfamily pyrophosphatase or phosphodiesterase
MRRRTLLIIAQLLLSISCLTAQVSRPKLVVGLVIDQMRWDYLYRYNDLYGANGFKRLLKEGFTCENTMIPYVPTYTAVGHTCIYTGSVPASTGIVGNNWFNKITAANVYCTDDSTVSTVGTNSAAGKMSPDNLWVTTITDELRLSNNFKSKVIGIALKDRGAILPAGHTANAAYWYDNGKWISSTYYMNVLPNWVSQFNAKDEAGNFMSTDWNTLLPAAKYDLSTGDNMPYENPIKGETTVTFPHKLSSIGAADKYEAFKTTPFANTFTFDFAKTAIENEALGKNTVTDFLTVSISSTDYVGHSFGPNSIEIEDTYLRLDNDIADFLQYLDTKVGKGNYLFFITADHGVAHIPGFLNEHKIPGGSFSEADLLKELNQAVEAGYGLKNIVQNLQNYQVYINTNEIEKQGKDIAAIKTTIINTLKQKPYIITAFSTDAIQQTTLPQPQREMLINGYNPKRSGDIQFTLRSGFFDGGKKGTTHGLWNPYDAHIPLVWFGWNIKPGKTNRETYMTDISATIAAMLRIQMPSGCVGKVITEVGK